MSYIKYLIYLAFIFGSGLIQDVAFADGNNGQMIQIETNFRSFVGKPTWMLTIRDLDNDLNIPYVFNIERGQNSWVAFTGGRNFLITASNLQISSFRPRYDDYREWRIENFCHIESNGRIVRGESMIIRISGDLTPNLNGIKCNVSKYPDANIPIVN